MNEADSISNTVQGEEEVEEEEGKAESTVALSRVAISTIEPFFTRSRKFDKIVSCRAYVSIISGKKTFIRKSTIDGNSCRRAFRIENWGLGGRGFIALSAVISSISKSSTTVERKFSDVVIVDDALEEEEEEEEEVGGKAVDDFEGKEEEGDKGKNIDRKIEKAL